MPRCTKCGNNVPDWASYCVGCGSPVNIEIEVRHIDYMLAETRTWLSTGLVSPDVANAIQEHYRKRREWLCAHNASEAVPPLSANLTVAAPAPSSFHPTMPSPAGMPAANRSAWFAEFLQMHWLKLISLLASLLVFAGMKQVLGWKWIDTFAISALPLLPIGGCLAAFWAGRIARTDKELGAFVFPSIGIVLAFFAEGSVNKHWLNNALPPLLSYSVGAMMSGVLGGAWTYRSRDSRFVHYACLAVPASVLLFLGHLDVESRLLFASWPYCALSALFAAILAFLAIASARYYEEGEPWKRTFLGWSTAWSFVAICWAVGPPLFNTGPSDASSAATLLALAACLGWTARSLNSSVAASMASVLLISSESALLAMNRETDQITWGCLFAGIATVAGTAAFVSRREQNAETEAAYTFFAGVCLILASLMLVPGLFNHSNDNSFNIGDARPALLGLWVAALYMILAVATKSSLALIPYALAVSVGTFHMWRLGVHWLNVDMASQVALAPITPVLAVSLYSLRSVQHERDENRRIWFMTLPAIVLTAGCIAIFTGISDLADSATQSIWILALPALAALWACSVATRECNDDFRCLYIGVVSAASYSLAATLGYRLFPGQLAWAAASVGMAIAAILGALAAEETRRRGGHVPGANTVHIVSIAFLLLASVMQFPTHGLLAVPASILVACALLELRMRSMRGSFAIAAFCIHLTTLAQAFYVFSSYREQLLAIVIPGTIVAISMARLARIKGLTYCGALFVMAGMTTWYCLAITGFHIPNQYFSFAMLVWPAVAMIFLDGMLPRGMVRKTSGVLATTIGATACLLYVDAGHYWALLEMQLEIWTVFACSALFAIVAWRRVSSIWTWACAVSLGISLCMLLALHVDSTGEWAVGAAVIASMWSLALYAIHRYHWHAILEQPTETMAVLTASVSFFGLLIAANLDEGFWAVGTGALLGTQMLSMWAMGRHGAYRHVSFACYFVSYALFITDRFGASVGTADLYLIPVGIYLVCAGHVAASQSKTDEGGVLWWLGSFVVLSPTFAAFYIHFNAGDQMFHSVLLVGECLAFGAWGIMRRIKAFVLTGALFAAAFTAVLGFAQRTEVWTGTVSLTVGVALLVVIFRISMNRDRLKVHANRIAEQWRDWK